MNREWAALILVNYFSDNELLDFLRNELGRQTIQPYIIVVNNGSHNVKSLAAYCNSNDIVLIDSMQNVGYMGGFVQAIDFMLNTNHYLPPWLILANHDIHFDKNNFFKTLQEKTYPQDVAGIGPGIISMRSGKNQNPFLENRISLKKLRFLKVVFSNYITYFLYQLAGNLKAKISVKMEKQRMQRSVYSIHGSFMCLRNTFIEKVLPSLRKAPFLFGEEIQIAELSQQNNLKLLYDPSLKIYHNEHQITGLFISQKSFHALKQSINHSITIIQKAET
jgi:GT2 family glycosyltransferase